MNVIASFWIIPQQHCFCPVRLCHWCWGYFWIKYWLRQTYYAPHARPNQGSNSWPPDNDSTFHVTETPALDLTTWPLVLSRLIHSIHLQAINFIGSFDSFIHEFTVYLHVYLQLELTWSVISKGNGNSTRGVSIAISCTLCLDRKSRTRPIVSVTAK